MPLVLSLAPCSGAGCCPRSPLPWHWGRLGAIAGPRAAGNSGWMPGNAKEFIAFADSGTRGRISGCLAIKVTPKRI